MSVSRRLGRGAVSEEGHEPQTNRKPRSQREGGDNPCGSGREGSMKSEGGAYSKKKDMSSKKLGAVRETYLMGRDDS